MTPEERHLFHEPRAELVAAPIGIATLAVVLARMHAAGLLPHELGNAREWLARPDVEGTPELEARGA